MKLDDRRQGAHPDYVRQAAEDSLRRLGIERIDLYQLHQPDPATPIADTLGALDELKIRASAKCGRSAARTSPRSNCGKRGRQPRRRSAFRQRAESVQPVSPRAGSGGSSPECRKEGLAFLPFFPLANGILTGKYRRGEPAPKGSRGDARIRPEGLHRREPGQSGKADGIRERARAYAAGTGVFLVGGAAHGSVGDRGGHFARAGESERFGRGLEADRSRSEQRSQQTRRRGAGPWPATTVTPGLPDGTITLGPRRRAS